MITTDLGFDLEELCDSERWTAFVDVWAHPRGQPFAAHPRASCGAYAARVAGEGAPNPGEIWGVCFTTSDDVLRAFAVQHLLQKLPATKTMLVRCRGLLQILKDARAAMPRGGLKADARTPFDGFELFEGLIQAMDAGRWTLEPLPKRPEFRGLLLAGQDIDGKPKLTAEAYTALQTQVEPNTLFASSDDPDPAGLMSE